MLGLGWLIFPSYIVHSMLTWSLTCALYHFQVWEKNSVVCYHGNPVCVLIHPNVHPILARVLRLARCFGVWPCLQLYSCICARYFCPSLLVDSQKYLVNNLFTLTEKTVPFIPLPPSLVLRDRDIGPIHSDGFLHRGCHSFLCCGLHAAAAACLLRQRLEDAYARPQPAWFHLCAFLVVGRCVFACVCEFPFLLVDVTYLAIYCTYSTYKQTNH